MALAAGQASVEALEGARVVAPEAQAIVVAEQQALVRKIVH